MFNIFFAFSYLPNCLRGYWTSDIKVPDSILDKSLVLGFPGKRFFDHLELFSAEQKVTVTFKCSVLLLLAQITER